MTILEQLQSPHCWEKYYLYKAAQEGDSAFEKQLLHFIAEKGYLPVVGAILREEPFPLPCKAVISKQNTAKKRIVYTYPNAENIVLKLITYLMLRRYDHLFSPNLYSFRPGKTAKDAIRKLNAVPDIETMYSYKADISNYFNSVPIDRLLPMLEAALSDEPQLFAFLRRLLENPDVLEGGKQIQEQKGIMAGTPLSAFYANLYLRELDRIFAVQKIPYARYSDDMIAFAPTAEERDRLAKMIREFLAEYGLSLNPEKECFASPEEGWVFLGFRTQNGTVDIAPASVVKIKQKMRRKTRALSRWAKRGHHTGEQAAAAFIRIFRHKLLEPPEGRELSWSSWFFPVINTAESLRIIDNYAQDCLRYLISGTHTKARFNVRYDTLKALGWKSLVHEYYLHRSDLP